ncbi:glycosyltransferase [Methylomicrobium lacus]|uniref:glycosyltransferase n=1 Tax=Methylomicrobium lacus TaxID=136992 RepID=UPI0035A88FB9
MKVLHILSELNPSGGESMLYAAGPLLKDFDISGEILSTGNQVGPYAGQLASAGYTIHHIAFKKSPWFFWKVFKLLNGNNYDVIHLHTEQANFWYGILTLLTAKRCIRTIHSTFDFTGFLCWRRKWQRLLLDLLGITHISISQSVQDIEYKHYSLQTPVIQNWYNSLRFQLTTPQQRAQARADLKLASDSFVLLTIGNCSPIKNHTALIKALAENNQHNWVYLHIGIEKDSTERDLSAELGVAERIRFYGLQTDILPFLQAADLFVMPSTHEGFGVSAVEAIATGLPALLTNVPGLADFKSVFQGLFYCEPNPESIASALTGIIALNQKQLLQQCAKNQTIAEQLFGVQRGFSSYVDFYKKRHP